MKYSPDDKNQIKTDVALYRTLLNNLDQGYCIIKMIFDESGTPVDYIFLETNPAFDEQTGLKDAIGKRIKDLNPSHEDYWFEIYGDVARTGKPVHFENRVAGLKGGVLYDVHAFRIGNPGEDLVAVFFKDITFSKQLERNLQESEARYRELVSNARTIIIKVDSSGKIIFLNSYGLSFFGYTGEEIIGKTATETILPVVESTGRNLGELIEKIYHDPPQYPVNINENRKKNGEKVWIEWYNNSLKDDDGKHIGLIAVGVDVTESKKNKDALIESEARFRLIAETLPVMVCITRSSDSVVLFTNEVNNRAFGMKGEDIIGTTGPKYYWDPADRQKMIEIFREKGFVDNHLLKVKRNDGSPFWIITSVRPIVYQGEDAMIGASIDVTRDRQVEAELEESQRRLHLALENGKIGMIDWNKSKNEVILDERAAHMLGLEQGTSKITYRNFEALINEDDLPGLRNSIKKLFNSTSPMETIFRIGSGESDYISMRANVVNDDEGKPDGMFGVCLDMTELKKGTEKALVRLNDELLRSNNDLQQFAYVASHDLQEPLRMISSFSQLLQLQYGEKLDEKANQYIKFAVDGSRRMYDLLNGLLAYSRIQTKGTGFREISMESVVQKVSENLRLRINETGAEISTENLPLVKADENQMIQLIQNLIDNSIKFCKRKPVILISCRRKKGTNIFCVKDNGIGIEKQYFDRIFRIFQRLHSQVEYKGTGIGLALVRRIVERHGGVIWVESTPGEGSAFYFTIPCG